MTEGKPMTLPKPEKDIDPQFSEWLLVEQFADGITMREANIAKRAWQAATKRAEESRQDLDRRTLMALEHCRDWLPQMCSAREEAQGLIAEISALLGDGIDAATKKAPDGESEASRDRAKNAFTMSLDGRSSIAARAAICKKCGVDVNDPACECDPAPFDAGDKEQG